MVEPRLRDLAEPLELAVGAHAVAFVPPDIYIMRQVGDFSAAEVSEMLDKVADFIEGKSAVFSIIEQSRAGKVSSDARKVLLSRMSPALVGVAFVDVPAMARIGLSFGYKAYLMMNRGRELAHAFVDNEAQAHEWIAQQKKRRSAAGASAG
jgi:hypothetical protein